MMSLARTSIRLQGRRALAPGLEALVGFLLEHNYSSHAIDQVAAFAAAEGTPTGSPYLDPEDEAAATDAFIDNLPDVAGDSPAWDATDVILDAELLAAGTHPVPIRPVRGGSIEADGFEPTAADLADYAAWSAELDRRNAAAEAARAPTVAEVRAWYDSHPLSEFNAIRAD